MVVKHNRFRQGITASLILMLLVLTLPTLSRADTPSLAEDMEDIRRGLIELRRDLAILEEDLLYPASAQVAVYLAVDVGTFFQLDSVTLHINGREVTHYLYTDRQVEALHRGGVQRLYLGNLRQGSHELSAVFTGKGPQGRDYRRATSVAFEKSFEPVYVELRIQDDPAGLQPRFIARAAP